MLESRDVSLRHWQFYFVEQFEETNTNTHTHTLHLNQTSPERVCFYIVVLVIRRVCTPPIMRYNCTSLLTLINVYKQLVSEATETHTHVLGHFSGHQLQNLCSLLHQTTYTFEHRHTSFSAQDIKATTDHISLNPVF